MDNQSNGMTNAYNTPLSKEEDKRFQSDLMKKAAESGKPVDRGYDYDVQGFFKSGSSTDERGHGTDRFKKPNHPTFSDQSQYQDIEKGIVGGKWIGNDFKPSPYNLKNMPLSKLDEYFRQVEPNSKVLR